MLCMKHLPESHPSRTSQAKVASLGRTKGNLCRDRQLDGTMVEFSLVQALE